ncbi:MAG: succinate dehydrogenase [Gemmatimonadota bacterium]
MRTDAWWIQPLITFLILSSFIVYATWSAFQGDHYYFGSYISPFYSPEIFGASPHALFGPKPGWWPGWMKFSPALLILWAPGGFRFTCYYYRGAYYKALWADPVNCAVGEPRKSYWGEHSFPLILQNLHRFFLFIAIPFLLFLAKDLYEAFWFVNAAGTREFGVGVGTLILATNLVLLGGYTLGCHSFRHAVGGLMDRLSERPVRKTLYDCSSCLNRAHMKWAWCSLVMVAFSDIYIRLCSMGIWHDWRLF